MVEVNTLRTYRCAATCIIYVVVLYCSSINMSSYCNPNRRVTIDKPSIITAVSFYLALLLARGFKGQMFNE